MTPRVGQESPAEIHSSIVVCGIEEYWIVSIHVSAKHGRVIEMILLVCDWHGLIIVIAQAICYASPRLSTLDQVASVILRADS